MTYHVATDLTNEQLDQAIVEIGEWIDRVQSQLWRELRVHSELLQIEHSRQGVAAYARGHGWGRTGGRMEDNPYTEPGTDRAAWAEGYLDAADDGIDR